METGGKYTFHKGCNCAMCRLGRNRYKRNLNERKLRRMSKKELLNYVLKGAEDAHIHPISTPYTD